MCELHKLQLEKEELDDIARRVSMYSRVDDVMLDRYKQYITSCFNFLQFHSLHSMLSTFYAQHVSLGSIFATVKESRNWLEVDDRLLVLKEYGFRMFATMIDLHTGHSSLSGDTLAFNPSVVAFKSIYDLQSNLE